MDNLLIGLSNKQIEFIAKECGISKENVEKASNDEAYGFYDVMCDIEIEETCKAEDDDLSDRGKMAEEIVTLIGEKIRIVNGYPDE